MNKLFLFEINVGFALITLTTLGYFLTSGNDCKLMMQCSYCIATVYGIISAKTITGKWFNLVSLFLLLIFFFGGTRIVLDMLYYEDMSKSLSTFCPYNVDIEVTNRSILNYNISVLSIIIGALLCITIYKKKIQFSNNNNKISFHIPNTILLFLLIIGLISQVYTSYLQFSFLTLFSYHESYISGVDIPKYIQVLNHLPVFVCLYKQLHGKFKWTFPLIVYSFLLMATGQRSFAFLLLIVDIYWLYRIGMIKMRLKWLLVGLFSMVLVSSAISNIRNNQGILEDDSDTLNFFWGQGVSFTVMQMSVLKEDNLNYHFKDLFGNVYSAFRFLPLTDIKPSSDNLTSTGAQYKIWSKYISLESNPQFYYAGMGMGGNYIAQIYCVGKEFFVFIISIFIGWVLLFVDFKIGNITNYFSTFIYFSFLETFLYIPRDNLFSFLTSIINPLLLIAVLYPLFILIKIGSNEKKYLYR